MKSSIPNVFVVRSTRTNKIYILVIVQVKMRNECKILNLYNMRLSTCTFNNIHEAIADIFRYQKQGKNIIVTSGLTYMTVKLFTKFSKRFTLNNKKIWS